MKNKTLIQVMFYGTIQFVAYLLNMSVSKEHSGHILFKNVFTF